MADNLAITVRSVSKTFRLPHEKSTSIKGVVVNFYKRNKSYELQEALKNISFEVKRGEFFGVIGRNGSGKSTLLKLLAGIYSPDKGIIQVNGKLTPFIELGVGFNPELTGRENVFLNGALLGFSRKEMRALYDEIVEFAELEQFMDQKLKNYSSGMQVRLAFSIAVRAKGDILVLDEVLAVGDYEFQQKCFEYFKYLKKIKSTVVLVSHDMNNIKQFCTRGVYIERGHLMKFGSIADVTAAYINENTKRAISKDKQFGEQKGKTITSGIGAAVIEEVYTEDASGKRTNAFKPRERMSICFRIRASRDISDATVGMIFSNATGQTAFATNSLDQGIKVPDLKKGETITVSYKLKNLYDDGTYVISGAIASKDRTAVYARVEQAQEFRSIGWDATAKATFYAESTIDFTP